MNKKLLITSLLIINTVSVHVYARIGSLKALAIGLLGYGLGQSYAYRNIVHERQYNMSKFDNRMLAYQYVVTKSIVSGNTISDIVKHFEQHPEQWSELGHADQIAIRTAQELYSRNILVESNYQLPTLSIGLKKTDFAAGNTENN